MLYIYFCVLSIFISPFLLLLSASEKCLSSMWILNYFWTKNCVFDFVFLLENFLFINLLLHVNLLIVDGFPSINKQISTFKKKYFDDIIKKTRRQTPLLVLLFTGKWYFTWQLKWITCFERVAWKKKRRGLSEFNGMSTMCAKNVYFKFHGEYGNILWCKMSVCLSKLLFWF